jgi:hypothetical protein
MQSVNNFTYQLSGDRICYHSQCENGIHIAEIRDSEGQVESAITALTASEVHRWIADHDGITE